MTDRRDRRHGRAAGGGAEVVGRLASRLAVFVALATFAAVQWLSLLTDPPLARAAGAVGAITVGACLIALIEAAGLRRRLGATLALATSLAAGAVALLAVGLPASMLFPAGWSELGAGIDRGLEGLGGEVEFPYSGGEEWSRLVLLGGLVCLLALGAALAFWPRRPAGSGTRIAGLVILVGIYAASAAMRPGPESLLAGLGLLLLITAWLWLPGLGRRPALAAGALIAALGALSLPLAAALEGRPWVDYRDWRLAAPAEARSFRWDHSYGPLLPRDGKPMLEVKSDAPRYWRAAVLDEFNGYTWERSARDVGQPSLELPTRVDRGTPGGGSGRLNPEWVVSTEFTVRKLESEYAIAPGALRRADGVELDPTPNGTTLADDGRLTEGRSYTTLSYAPDPSADQMRQAPDRYAPALAHHTTIKLPRRDAGPGQQPLDPRVVMPLRGGDRSAAGGRSAAAGERAARRLADSRYGDIYRLARRVTAGAPTTYDAVKAVEVHLQSSYEYFEDVRAQSLPLRGFLFEDRAGYCEQFSGAMALMLRMLGVPTRVAAGFSPGTPDTRPGRYLVRDLDAHSWVEVYFTGIGWVPFDPTPTAAPAQSQAGGLGAVSAAGTGGGTEEAQPARESAAGKPEPAAASGPAGGVPLWPLGAALGLVALAGAGLTTARVLRYRALSPAAAAEARTRELASALERLGWGVPASITLLGLEDRLRAARRPTAAAYAARLREVRYGDRNGAGLLPSLSERRRMRRELRRFRSWQMTVGSYRSIPPGAPRR